MSSGGGGQNSTVTNKTDIPPWLQEAAASNLYYANQVSERPYLAYPGQQVATPTGNQQAAWDYTRQNLNTGAAGIAAAGAPIAGSRLTETAQGLLNPYLSAVEKPALQALGDQEARTQNDIAARATSAGAFGGTRFGVQSGIEAGQAAQQAGQLSAGIRAQGWDKAVSTALAQAQTGAQIAGAQQTAGLQAASALSAAGFQEQQQHQAQLTSMLNDWQDQWNYPLHQLAIREGAVTSTPYGGTTASTQPINKANPWLGAAGGALSGAAAGATLGASLGAGGGPWGAAAGAVIGGIGGALR